MVIYDEMIVVTDDIVESTTRELRYEERRSSGQSKESLTYKGEGGQGKWIRRF